MRCFPNNTFGCKAWSLAVLTTLFLTVLAHAQITKGPAGGARGGSNSNYLSNVDNAQATLAQAKTTLDALVLADDSTLVDKAQSDLAQVSDDLDALRKYINSMPPLTLTARGGRGSPGGFGGGGGRAGGGGGGGGTGIVQDRFTPVSIPQNLGNPAMQSVLSTLQRVAMFMLELPQFPNGDARKKVMDDVSQMETNIIVALSVKTDSSTTATTPAADAAPNPDRRPA
jgi:hypothetical protein